MNIKEQVCKIYPNAIAIKDSHNYGKSGSDLNYIILHNNFPSNIIKESKNEIILDFPHVRNKTEIHPLSKWCASYEEAWKSAWETLQDKMEKRLSS